MPERLSPQEEARYPNLVATGYAKTSHKDPRYNCVAWAADWETKLWWQAYPKRNQGQHWPDGVPDGFYVENYIRAFGTLGYEVCDSQKLERGYEKIALYEDNRGLFGHVAKQLPSGKWASKLGAGKDIVHNSVEAFKGRWIGPVRFMRRHTKGIRIPGILKRH